MLRACVVVVGMAGAPLAAALLPPQLPGTAQATSQGTTGTPELLFDQGKRLFDAFQYDQAVPIFDRLVAQLTAGGQIQKPDLLVQAYELRARARFANGDSAGTEQDFSALLTVKPGYQLGAGISPRVVAVFEGVKKLTVGQMVMSLTPAGEVMIDGTAYPLTPDPRPVDLPAGEHQVTVTRQGYAPIDQRFTVTAGGSTPLALTLERVSATLKVRSNPEGVEVVWNGTARGVTERATTAVGAVAELTLADLQPGMHRLLLRRPCYTSVEQSITIDRPRDLETETLQLVPAVASVKIDSPDPGATVFVDRVAKGTAPLTLQDICEGPHVIEVRGPKGLFIDRREWKTGDSVTLDATLRRPFPIVSVTTAPGGLTAEQLRVNVERALAPAKQVLVYLPDETTLQAAVKQHTVMADWLAVEAASDASRQPRVPKEVRRDLGRKLAQSLDAHGVAGISSGSDPYVINLSLLAAGSGDPDVIAINMTDAASVASAVELLGSAMPALVRPSIEASVVDVAGVKGAVVVRAVGQGAKAGLATGDTIVGAGGAAVSSVAELRARIAAVKPPAATLPLELVGPTGTPRKLAAPVTLVPDTLPLRDPRLLYNRALLELRETVKSAPSPIDRSTAQVNLAIVHMRLGNWDDAQAELASVKLADGPGVSAGTVAYLSGLCLEALGRAVEAQAAYTRAAAAAQARLSHDGPLIAPLAQQKLRTRR